MSSDGDVGDCGEERDREPSETFGLFEARAESPDGPPAIGDL